METRPIPFEADWSEEVRMIASYLLLQAHRLQTRRHAVGVYIRMLLEWQGASLFCAWLPSYCDSGILSSSAWLSGWLSSRFPHVKRPLVRHLNCSTY